MSAVTAYRITDLGRIDDPEQDSVALNNVGDVALTVGNKAFRWRSGRRTALSPVKDYPDMAVTGLNDRGQCVGGVSESGSGAYSYTYSNAVLWDGGRVVSLGSLPGLSDATATAINDRGQVVGDSGTASVMEATPLSEDRPVITDVTHAFLWANGKMRDLGEGTASALNAAGLVAGTIPFSQSEANSLTTATHAAVWRKGAWHDLGSLPGWTFSVATAINSTGEVSGYAFNGMERDTSKAFLWHDRSMADLGPGKALALNAQGQVVGEGGGRALLWWRGERYDLTTCLLHKDGWVLTNARGINDRGQIVGFGTRGGQNRAFLLTPAHVSRHTLHERHH